MVGSLSATRAGAALARPAMIGAVGERAGELRFEHIGDRTTQKTIKSGLVAHPLHVHAYWFSALGALTAASIRTK